MVDYQLFNQYKAAGWKCNTKEEFQKWQETFKEYWNELDFANAEQKQRLLEQIKELKAKKEAYFDKSRTFPKKESFIFRPEEGVAFIRLCNSLSAYLDNLNPKPSKPPEE